MARANLGALLVIANPTSHSGKGAAAVREVERFFASYANASTSFCLRETAARGDAHAWAAEAAGYDTLIALGGDGVIHEVVNGLMELPQDKRPLLGVVPVGTGNDFARTLGLTCNDAGAVLEELLTGSERTIDVGRVTSDVCPQGVHFVETLSFGLDAAIALDTTERRSGGTRQEGTSLFVTSSIKMFARARKPYPCRLRIDGGEEQQLRSLILAVQNGPTYGAGFRICPAALPNDGLLSVCYNVRQPHVARLLMLLAMARFGWHTGSRAVRLCEARALEASFEVEDGREPCPCQVDGEELLGSSFAVEVVPRALRVIVPRTCRW